MPQCWAYQSWAIVTFKYCSSCALPTERNSIFCLPRDDNFPKKGLSCGKVFCLDNCSIQWRKCELKLSICMIASQFLSGIPQSRCLCDDFFTSPLCCSWEIIEIKCPPCEKSSHICSSIGNTNSNRAFSMEGVHSGNLTKSSKNASMHHRFTGVWSVQLIADGKVICFELHCAASKAALIDSNWSNDLV